MSSLITGVVSLIFVDFGSVFNCLYFQIMSIFLHANVTISVYKCIQDQSHVTGLSEHLAVVKTSENLLRLWNRKHFRKRLRFSKLCAS
jgi:hypothetical protein